MNCRRILYILLGLLLAGCPQDPEPLASFSADTTTPLVGDIVSFTNTSIFATSYQWEFGDGETSSNENPTHKYTTDGTFTVELTAKGDGGSNSTSITITVSNLQPVAKFKMSKSTAKVDEVISFTNESENAESYSWSFGDSETSTIVHPTHSYAAAGTYTVELTATGDGGSHSDSKVITIVPPPVAAFYMDKSPADVGETITFTNISNYATSYSWDFGDGSTSTNFNETHSYAAEGNYTVQLTATGEGGVHSVSHNVSIASTIPTNIFAGQGVMNINLGETWGVISPKKNDWEYIGYFNATIGIYNIVHVVKSPSLDIELYLVSIQTSTTLANEDKCIQINCRENFIGQTEIGIMIGSALTEVETKYGPPENHDTEQDNYWYGSLGIGFGYDASSNIDGIFVYDHSAKKSIYIIQEVIGKAHQMIPDIDYQLEK